LPAKRRESLVAVVTGVVKLATANSELDLELLQAFLQFTDARVLGRNKKPGTGLCTVSHGCQ